jgi:diguanylate cyclase (GGDEF)-like protein
VTLHRQLVIFISFVWLALMAGVFWLHVQTARDLLEEQLHVHAQDTANSLGLSISAPLGSGDTALVESMVGAIFDSGYYREITLRDGEGKPLLARRLDPIKRDIPRWFIQALSIAPTAGVSEISHQWRMVGKLVVMADPDKAYLQLWDSARQGVYLFLMVGGVSLAVLWTIVRTILRPLRALEQQAEAICQRDFTGQQPLPRTRELRRVVQAMNRMTRQLKTLFDEQVAQIEQVRNQAYVDNVTGLGNGRFFNAQLQGRLDSVEEPFTGALVKIEITGMSQFNQEFGHDSGNWLLKQIGKLWREHTQGVENNLIARVTGARFVALLPHLDREQSLALVTGFCDGMRALEPFGRPHSPLGQGVGVSVCSVGQDATLIESQTDAALQKSLKDGQGTIEIFDPQQQRDALAQKVVGVEDWEAFLKDVISARRVVFHYQPVVSCTDQSLLHYEVLARIKAGDQVLSAGLFMPLVERYKLVMSFDQMIVGTLMAHLIRKEPAQRLPIAINISSHSLREEGFVDWLLETLSKAPDVARYVILEVPEVAVRTAHGRLKTLAEGVKRLGAKLTIDHFGSTNSSFGYLSGLPLYAIKVDQSYIRDIGDNLENQFFVQSLVRIAHSRQVLLTAEMVESAAQWDMLRRFQLDGGQGFFLGKPADINLLST